MHCDGCDAQLRYACAPVRYECTGCCLGHGAKDRIVPADGRATLVVFCLCMAHLVELGLRRGGEGT
jgi:hypothetical protein